MRDIGLEIVALAVIGELTLDGTNSPQWVALGSQKANQVTIFNNTGQTLEISRGTASVALPAGNKTMKQPDKTAKTYRGIRDVATIYVKNNGAVTFNWEAEGV